MAKKPMDPTAIANLMAGAAVKKVKMNQPKMDADGDTDAAPVDAGMKKPKSKAEIAAIKAKSKGGPA